MEKDIQEGSIGSAVIKQEGGIGSVSEQIGPIEMQLNPFLKAKLSLNASLELDEKKLIESLISKYGPQGILGDLLKAGEAALP